MIICSIDRRTSRMSAKCIKATIIQISIMDTLKKQDNNKVRVMTVTPSLINMKSDFRMSLLAICFELITRCKGEKILGTEVIQSGILPLDSFASF